MYPFHLSTEILFLIGKLLDKVLSLLEARLDLILSPSPSMKIQMISGKITENMGFESPLRNAKKCLFF